MEQYSLHRFVNLDSFDEKDESLCIKSLQEKVHGEFSEHCMDQLHMLPVLRTYVSFKQEHEFEHYLLLVRDFGLRNALSKFRLSSHNLEIEKGRHSRPKIPAQDRKCTKCNKNVVEDEIHFLFECDLYTSERRVLLNKLCELGINYNPDPVIHFKDIMTMKGDAPFYVSLFLYKCFKKHDAGVC